MNHSASRQKRYQAKHHKSKKWNMH